MKLRYLPFVILPVFFTVVGELFLKASLNGLGFKIQPETIMVGVLQPKVLLGIICIVIAACLWVVAMSKFELSFIYPFLSIDYIAIIIGSQIVLGEQVPFLRYISAGLIITGLIIISRSPHSVQKNLE